MTDYIDIIENILTNLIGENRVKVNKILDISLEEKKDELNQTIDYTDIDIGLSHSISFTFKDDILESWDYCEYIKRL